MTPDQPMQPNPPAPNVARVERVDLTSDVWLAPIISVEIVERLLVFDLEDGRREIVNSMLVRSVSLYHETPEERRVREVRLNLRK